MSSSVFEVQSFRDGKTAIAIFKEGNLENYKEEDTKQPNGTLIKFKPDEKVFTIAEEGLTYKRICSEIKNIAYLNKGVRFIIKDVDSGEKEEYYSKNGIADFISESITKPLMKNPIICSAKDDSDEVEIAFIWTGGPSASYVFVNGLFCSEGGTPNTGAKTTLTSSIKRLSKKDFDSELIRKGLVYAINCKVASPSFSNQTKSKVNNPNLRTLTSKALKEGLEEFAHSPEFNSIIDLMSRFQKAENAAEKARMAVLEHSKEMNGLKKKKLAFIDKLSDAEILGQDSILTIVEGK